MYKLFTNLIIVIGLVVCNNLAVATNHSGQITSDATWYSAGNPHIITGTVIVDGAKLTMEPGVRVYLNQYQSLIIQNGGTLKAIAPTDNKIYFSSIDSTNPSAGDWGQLLFSGSVNDTLSNCIIRYGGRGGYYVINPVVEVNNSNSYFNRCKLYNHSQMGFKFSGSPQARVSDCQIYNCGAEDHNNGDAFCVDGDLSLLPTIYFTHPESLSSYIYSNWGNGIRLNGTLTSNATWRDMGPCYWLRSVDLNVSNCQLTLEPGVIIKFSTYRFISFENGGTLHAIGNTGNAIYFTSYRDDYRQDTDGGGSSNGAAGDWGQLLFSGSVNDTLSNCIIRYGGRGGYYVTNAMVNFTNSNPSLTYCQLDNGIDTLISITHNSNPSIHNCTLLFPRTKWGMVNQDTTRIINADSNYWNDPSGPYDQTNGHPDYNPNGLGCRVSDYIQYRPWLDSIHVSITGDDDKTNIPNQYILSQNYPNPFNPFTTIEYILPKRTFVTLQIYDVLGRLVKILVNDEQPAGYHQITWDASGQASGMYFYRFQAGRFVEKKKMTLLK